jgi:hypothetical protein
MLPVVVALVALAEVAAVAAGKGSTMPVGGAHVHVLSRGLLLLPGARYARLGREKGEAGTHTRGRMHKRALAAQWFHGRASRRSASGGGGARGGGGDGMKDRLMYCTTCVLVAPPPWPLHRPLECHRLLPARKLGSRLDARRPRPLGCHTTCCCRATYRLCCRTTCDAARPLWDAPPVQLAPSAVASRACATSPGRGMPPHPASTPPLLS